MTIKHIIYLLCITLFVACSSKKPNEPEQKGEAESDEITLSAQQQKNAGISTGTFQEKVISTTLHVNGKIDVPPQNMVSISAPLGGYLKTTQLLPGMHLDKNQVIATMEDPQYIQLQQDYLTAKARGTYYQKDYQRQKDLNESKASSDKVMQQAEAEYTAQKILASALAQKLQLIGIDPTSLTENNISRSVKIHSPIKGYVSKVNVNIGKYVSPTDVLFELIDPEDIHLSLKVFEKDINQLFVGQKIIAYTNSDPTKKYLCEIILISRDVSEDRSVVIHCHFEAYDKLLIPGTYMNADIELTNKPSKVLPEAAIVRFEGKQYLFAVEKNYTYRMVPINTGATENGLTVIHPIASPLPETIVVKGAYNLLMTMKNKGE
jgi:membrane fusion protein, heavy metal efflux system